ncbi:hypothetical protein GGF32_006258 [Allomyces javanicus]|nr:hypothetical protein GGF32_006258 [Allomyces javanicus]
MQVIGHLSARVEQLERQVAANSHDTTTEDMSVDVHQEPAQESVQEPAHEPFNMQVLAEQVIDYQRDRIHKKERVEAYDQCFKDNWQMIIPTLPVNAQKLIGDVLQVAHQKMRKTYPDVDIKEIHALCFGTRKKTEVPLQTVAKAEPAVTLDEITQSYDQVLAKGKLDKQDIAFLVQSVAGTRGDLAFLYREPNEAYPYLEWVDDVLWIKGNHVVVKTATRDNSKYEICVAVPPKIAKCIWDWAQSQPTPMLFGGSDPTKMKQSFLRAAARGGKAALGSKCGALEMRRAHVTADINDFASGKLNAEQLERRCNSRAHSVHTACTVYYRPN